MNKLPSFQFYPADWRKDPGVQSLSFHDRGVWFEILCLMHESEQRGKLLLNGKAMPEDALARLLGLDKQALVKVLKTLSEYGVTSLCQDTGALMSRRMVRDEALRSVRSLGGHDGGIHGVKGREHGVKGKEFGHLGGRPKATNSSTENNPPLPIENNPPLEREKTPGLTPPPSSSSSSSNTKTTTRMVESKILEKTCAPETIPKKAIYPPEFCEFWSVYPRPIDKSRAMKAWNARIKEGAEPQKIIRAAINYADYCSQNGTEERFIKHPSTFLNPDWLEWAQPRQPRKEPLELSL